MLEASLLEVFSWPRVTLAAGLLVSLGAGVVRGFAGFGYSALTVAGLSLFVSPSRVIPAVLVLEILASLSLLTAGLQDSDRAWTKSLLLGNLVFVPLGIAVLALMPENMLRLSVGAALLASAVSLQLTSRIVLNPNLMVRACAGVASGLLNGMAASGGVAAAMLMAAAQIPARTLRATMVAFLLYTGPYVLLCAVVVPWSAGSRLLGIDTLRWACLLGPTMLGGIWIGKQLFRRSDIPFSRLHVLSLLTVISALTVVRALFDLHR